MPGGTVWPTPDDAGTGVIPLQLGPGRGDLRASSGFIPTFPTALGVINRTVSFARLFQSQPWVAAAVMRMLTWSVRVPLRTYQRTGAGEDDAVRKRLRPGDNPIVDAIHNPWPGGNQAQLIMNLLGPMLVHGNSVTEVDDGNVTGKIQFTPKDWRFSQPLMPWRDSLEGFKFDVDVPTLTHEVSIDKVLHLAWWSPIGPLGTSPLMQLGTTLTIEDAAQRWQIAMMRQGGRPPSAVMANESFLGINAPERKEIMKNLRVDMDELYGGPENAGRPALLPPGLEWKSVGQTTVESALIDQRKITREEIAGVYLIPPPLLGILDRATFSNIATQRDMTYTDCLGPWMILLEQAINGQIIRDLLQEDQIFVEFDFGAVLRGDRLAEIDAIRDGIASALFTPNEGRGILNMPQSDIEGMDNFFLPTVNNLAAIDQEQDTTVPPQLVPFAGINNPPKDPPSDPDDGDPDTPGPGEDDKNPIQRGQARRRNRIYVPSSFYDARN
jgi:HK97 family phage portal protein